MTLLRRHPLISYFVLAYLIAWSGSLALTAPKFLRGEAMVFADALIIFIPMLLGPSVAGIAMTWILDGPAGVRALVARLGHWRVGQRWYVVAIFLWPAIFIGVLGALSALISPVFLPRFFPLGIVIGILAGFFEEIGWMGFAYPRMSAQSNALTAAVLLGLLHTGWHALADFLGSSGSMGGYWLPHFLVWMVATFTAMRVIVAWIYVHTKSVLLTQLAHASSTGILSVLGPTLSPQNDTLLYAVYAVLLWVVVLIIARRYGPHLRFQRHPVMHTAAQAARQGSWGS